MLFVTAVDMDYPEYTEELSRQFWMRVWSRDEGITEDEHFTQAAKKAGMKDDIIKKALKRSKDKDVADRLQAFADEARANGAFGAPTMIVHVNGEKEMLFGSDRFNILAEMLGEKFDGPQNQLSKNKILTRYKSKWKNMDLKLKPLSQDAVLQGSGNQLPGNVPIKMQYILQDLARLGQHNEVPFKIPSDLKDVMFVKGSRPAMLFLTAVDMNHPEYTEELSRQLWLRVWSRDEGITTDDDISEAATKAGIKKEMIVKCLNSAKEQYVSDQFKAYTDEALSLGVKYMKVH
ncbi:GSTK1 [Mytilus coruscus]|uniref:GSTK1 n=1 Tax=Mytilus coruscus TaxID=42192 RepID=A0A6J7ZZP8_MYTCO|nr:GSTK1 [Mytilus coruscus]